MQKRDRTAGLDQAVNFWMVKSRCDGYPTFMIVWGKMLRRKETSWLPSKGWRQQRRAGGAEVGRRGGHSTAAVSDALPSHQPEGR